MTGETDIVFEGVSVDYGDRTALRNVTVALTQRRIAIIGSNGSGKSTFARMLNGLVTPSAGEVRVHGLNPARQAKQLRRKVGFIFSNPDSQIIMPTVAEDVAFSLRNRGITRSEVSTRVTAALERFGLSSHSDASAHSLSGGQKQLLALCAILISEPDLVVADEPTALLDASNSRRMREHLLDELSQQLVIVTHDMRIAARCDIALRFEHGRLFDHDSPATVIARYERDHA